MKRSFFVLAGTAAVVGCGANSDYTAVGGAHLFQQLNLDVAEFKAKAAACAADLAALADKGSQFVNMVWQTFGTRIKVAVGAAGFLEMSEGAVQ